MPENVTDDPRYQQAIAGIQAQMTGGGGSVAPRASQDEQDEYYDSIKEALLQQGLEESAPKKKERGGIHTVLKFFPGYAAGLQQRQEYDQRDEILNLEKQRQKGITADRQLKMRQQLDEVITKRKERQQRQMLGSALNQLQQGGLDPQATQELQGQVRQGLVGLGQERAALAYGQPGEEGSIQEQAFRDAIRQGKSPMEALQAVQAAGRAPQEPRALNESELAFAAAGGDPGKALELMKSRQERPTQTDLALRAAKGDKEAAAALELLKPQSGMDIQFDKDGKLLSIQTGGKGGKLPTATITQAMGTATTAKQSLDVVNTLRQIIETDPAAVSATGRVNLTVANLGRTLAESITPGDDATASKLEQLKTANVSSAEFLGQLLAFQVALLANPDGRISDADVKNAQKALGLGKKISSAADILPRLDQYETLLRARHEDAVAILGQSGQTVPPLPSKAQQAPQAQTITRQEVQQKLTPARKKAGWTLERLIEWYADQGYQVQ